MVVSSFINFAMLSIHIVVEKYDDHHLEIKQFLPACPDLKNPVSIAFGSIQAGQMYPLIGLFWMLRFTG